MLEVKILRKLGINFNSVNDLTDDEQAKYLAELGFSSVFTATQDLKRHHTIANCVAKHGLEYETIHAPFGHINDIWIDKDEGDVMEKELTDCIDICSSISVPIAVMHLSSGLIPPQITDIGRKRFNNVIEYAQKKNIYVAFENQRKLANLSWVLEYYGNDKNVGFCWDCGHEACFTPGREYMPIFGDRLMCLHIHDNCCEYNKDEHMIPFDGKYNFNTFARHIRTSGFEGSLMLEIFKKVSPMYAEMTSHTFLERAYNAANKLREMVDNS